MRYDEFGNTIGFGYGIERNYFEDKVIPITHRVEYLKRHGDNESELPQLEKLLKHYQHLNRIKGVEEHITMLDDAAQAERYLQHLQDGNDSKLLEMEYEELLSTYAIGLSETANAALDSIRGLDDVIEYVLRTMESGLFHSSFTASKEDKRGAPSELKAIEKKLDGVDKGFSKMGWGDDEHAAIEKAIATLKGVLYFHDDVKVNTIEKEREKFIDRVHDELKSKFKLPKKETENLSKAMSLVYKANYPIK